MSHSSSSPLELHTQGILNEEAFLQVQERVWATFGPDARPNLFEKATARALWKATLHAWSTGEEPRQFTTLSAATGSGKTMAALALAAYLASKGLRVTMLQSQVNELGSRYVRLQAFLNSEEMEQVALWSSAHRDDAGEQTKQQYLRDATEDTIEHFTDPPRFTVSECRKARILLTTHAAWKAGMEGGRDLGIGDSDLVIVDEDPALARVFAFTSVSIAALERALRLGHRAGPGGEFPPEALEVVERIRKQATQVEEDSNVNKVRLRCAPIVTPEDMEVLHSLDRKDVKVSCEFARESFEEVWSTLLALKAAGQGRVFFTSWSQAGKCFFAYASVIGPQARTVILDASAGYSTGVLSDSVYIVDDVPQPCYDNVDLTLVYPPELRGKLRPRGLYATRDGALEVYAWCLKFIAEHAVPEKPVLLYAKKDFLNMLATEEKQDIVVGGRPVHFVHFGTGRGFNEWKDCETYVRLADFYMSREDAIATTGSVKNRVFSYADLNALSSGKTVDPDVEALVKMRLLAASVQDAARSAIRGLDGNGRPRVPVKMFLVDPDPAVVATLKQLWPGIKDPKVIGDPKPRLSERSTKGTGHRAVKATLEFLRKMDHRGKPWKSRDLEQATGADRTYIPRLLQKPVIKAVLEEKWMREHQPGQAWVYAPKEPPGGVTLMIETRS